MHTGPRSAWPLPPCNTRAARLFHPSTPSAEVGAHLNLAQAALNLAQPLVGLIQGRLDATEALIHLVRQLQGRGWDRWAGHVEGGGWYAAHSRCVGAGWPGGEAQQETSASHQQGSLPLTSRLLHGPAQSICSRGPNPPPDWWWAHPPGTSPPRRRQAAAKNACQCWLLTPAPCAVPLCQSVPCRRSACCCASPECLRAGSRNTVAAELRKVVSGTSNEHQLALRRVLPASRANLNPSDIKGYQTHAPEGPFRAVSILSGVRARQQPQSCMVRSSSSWAQRQGLALERCEGWAQAASIAAATLRAVGCQSLVSCAMLRVDAVRAARAGCRRD